MSSPQRYIAHFDLDSFFVSVEVLKNPALKDLPVIVGGSRERGVVAACNYPARAFGIHSAMPMKKAIQLCPQATVIKGSYADYSKYSAWVTNIIAEKAPLFQKASIDEFYIDLTGMDKHFDVYQWVIDLRNEIIAQTKLPISFGLASNKMIAKIATDEAKPNGCLFVQPGMEQQFLAPLPVNKFPGVGKQTYVALQSMNIFFIKDILNYSADAMEEKLGKTGVDLWHKAQGKHESIVVPHHEAKSISTENTFHENTADMNFLIPELVRMTEKVAYELRQDEKLACCIAVKIRYPDFETISKQTAIAATFKDDELIPVAIELFNKLYKKGKLIRLLGVRLSELTDFPLQGNLFDLGERKKNLYKAIDAVKDKFGNTALQKGRVIKKITGKKSGRK